MKLTVNRRVVYSQLPARWFSPACSGEHAMRETEGPNRKFVLNSMLSFTLLDANPTPAPAPKVLL
jgi:hypothetical protein